MRINLDNAERIAFATSAGHGSNRWTELALYHRRGERRPFVAVSLGCSRVPGERELRRERVTSTIEGAIAAFDNSHLTSEIAEQAERWEDARAPLPAATVAEIKAEIRALQARLDAAERAGH